MLEKDILRCNERWKKTGEVREEEWMSRYLRITDKVVESLAWVYQVIDTLLFPVQCLFGVFYFGDFSNEESFPRVITEYEKGYEYFHLTENCLNFDILSNEPNCIGESFSFDFSFGTIIEMTITEVGKGYYCGKGIVNGYTTETGEILIKMKKQPCFLFDKYPVSPLEQELEISRHVIPNAKWETYNNAVYHQNQIVLNEYMKLRSPYII